jgi:Zn-dependent protease with chaperone function/tetratricopeptide (TPR) repeat protein
MLGLMRISTSRKTLAGERPLNPAERTALVIAGATTTLLFYVVTTAVAILLLAVSIILLIVVVGAARFGLAGFVKPMLDREWALFRIITRSLWLPEGASYRLRLTEREAPRLFQMARKLADRMEVRPPDEVFVEMSCGAWVQLHGLLRGRGKITLGVGYDLLAGLPDHEVEAVLAHEMAHAALVNRGFSRWMNKSLGRLVNMTNAVGGYNAARKQNKEQTLLSEGLHKLYDALTTRSVRLVATYSRQDEFEADAGAAEACGPPAIRWSLVHLQRLLHDLERLPWSERVARLETEQSFSRWLVGALAHESVKPRDQMRDAVDPFSTHPSLRDRIAALGASDSVAIPGRPGIELLHDPDRIATQLVAEIHRTAVIEERKNDRLMRRQMRKVQRPAYSSFWMLLGVGLVLVGVFGAVLHFASDSLGGVIGFGSVAVIGGALLQKGTHRDRRKLAIPKYGRLTWKGIAPDEATARQSEIESDLRRRYASTGKRGDAAVLIDFCFEALRDSDYLRAHVAGRLALEVEPQSVDAALGLGIAAGALGNSEQSVQLHEWVRREVGWRTPNVMWGVAWARCLFEDWAICEALLAQLVEKQPDQATFQSLLGLAKMSRGKMRTAEQHVKNGMALEPSNTAHAQLLAGYYIESGRLRDAEATLAGLRDQAEKDVDVAQLFLRLELLRHNLDEAIRWTRVVQSIDPEPVWVIRFGFMFETARFDDQAAAFFRKALEAGHFPEAHIGLARLQSAAGERDMARTHLLNALNAECERAPAAQSPLILFHDIVGLLNNLEDRRVQCRAYIAKIPDTQGTALAGRSVFVCAPEHNAAAAHLQRVVGALYPSASFEATKLYWEDAPLEQQPVRPIAPGVQRVI